MYWELSGDPRPEDSNAAEAIVPAVARRLSSQGTRWGGGNAGGLDRRDNHLNYPGSKWDNLKKGMQ